MKNFLSILLAIILLSMTSAHAETKVYQGVGEHFMTDETIESAKNKAELMAERDALEQVCFYVKSQSASRNSRLNTDEIITIAAGILRVTDTKFKINDDNNGLRITAIISADIDIDELEKLLERAVNERFHIINSKNFCKCLGRLPF